MLGLNLLPGFTNPLNIDNGLYKSLLELATAKIKMPNFSIRSAKNIGILEFSETYYRNLINLVGKLFINEIISLNDFIFHSLGSMNIADATYIKREGKKIHGAKEDQKLCKRCLLDITGRFIHRKQNLRLGFHHRLQDNKP